VSARHLEAVRGVLTALEEGKHEPDRLRRLALAMVLLEDVT
jgi:hypothetical protein